MPWFTSILVEPIYRLIFGPPLVGLDETRRTRGVGGARRQEGLVIVAGGVGGLDLCGTGLRYVLGADRVPYALEVYPWGHGFGRWLADLTNVANRNAKAASIAELVRRFKSAHPDHPVFLVAKSGGSGVGVQALEQLEADMVETAVLLAPALSPRYDLNRALRAVRRELVVFWSPLDVLVLGLGTWLLGTIDRVRTCAAGLVSFRVPRPDRTGDQQTRPYSKLRQVRWRPRMAATGNFGGHVGPDSPFFLKKYVAPLLRFDGENGP